MYSGNGTQDGTNTSITIPGCNEEVCKLRSGVSVPAEITFQAQTNPQKLLSSTEILVKIGGIDIFWTWERDVPVCPALLHGECPVNIGNNYTYRALTPARQLPVGTNAAMRLNIYDENDKTVVCYAVEYTVVE